MEYIRKSDGYHIQTKNNVNNVHRGDEISVWKSDEVVIKGRVSDIKHIVETYTNKQGLERSTHDIIVIIE